MTQPATDTSALIWVDPSQLIVGTNVRLDTRLDKEFIDSIRERGVLQPIVAYYNNHGQLVVLFGQRRTLAAVQTGRPTVPVAVIDQPDEADRLVDQLTENDHRAALTKTEKVAAIEQLAALGVSAGEIAKRTANPKKTVEAVLAVSRSQTARDAVTTYEHLTLEQAAVIAEFERDPEAVKQLLDAAQRGGFDHKAQWLRDQRIAAAERAKKAAELASTGLRIVDEPPYGDPKVRRLHELKQDGQEPLDEKSHRDCPGHAAYLAEEWNPTSEADDEGTYTRTWRPVFVCTDYRAHGHTYRWGTERKTVAEMTPEEREAARAARRDVIESNKAWDSATKVRQAWLQQFAQRKTPPKNAALYIAKALASCDHQIRFAMERTHRFARGLLGLGDEAYQPTYNRGQQVVDLCTSEGRATVLTLVMILAAYEMRLSRDTWRCRDAGVTEYLRFLEANGYELSDIEQRACDDMS